MGIGLILLIIRVIIMIPDIAEFIHKVLELIWELPLLKRSPEYTRLKVTLRRLDTKALTGTDAAAELKEHIADLEAKV